MGVGQWRPGDRRELEKQAFELLRGTGWSFSTEEGRMPAIIAAASDEELLAILDGSQTAEQFMGVEG